jgi:hypothetical protein
MVRKIVAAPFSLSFAALPADQSVPQIRLAPHDALLEAREAWSRRPTTDPACYASGWPPTVPPFLSRAGLFRNLFAMPDGRLLIERVPTARRPANSYDVIDRLGLLTGTISLPPELRIVGFGARTIYTASLDVSDIERLQRHPWP